MHQARIPLIAFILVAMLETTLARADQDDLLVRDAWIREAPPNASVLAGYLTLVNPGSDPRRLTGVESGQFDSVEMHRTIHEDGMAKMAPQPYLDLPPGGTVELVPGGYHLMLMMPSRRFVEGDVVSLDLIFQGGGRMTVPFEVRKSESGGGEHQHHQHH